MQDPQVRETPTSRTDGAVSPSERSPAAKAGLPRRRERHTVGIVLGLAGLLGVAWAVAIVSRYPNLLAG